jgi:hypothetical protein
MSERDLLDPLRAADRALSATTLSSAARERIGDSLRTAANRAPRPRSAILGPAIAFALGGAAVWLLLPGGAEPAAPRPEAQPAVRAAGFTWEGSRCSATERDGGLSLDGWCRVSMERIGLSISSRRQAELVRLDDGVRLAAGSAEFEVAHREGGPPVQVRVSAGIIEVTGTRFIVEQERGGGHVDLLEGSIRFRAVDGSVTPVQQGTRFAWVDRSVAAPPVAEAPVAEAPVPAPSGAEAPVAAPSGSAPPVAAPPVPVEDRSRIAPRPMLPAEAAAGVIERVQALRAERRYQEAVELLRQERARSWEHRTAEILSFEEGDLLERVGDERAACLHWRAHQARFRGRRYRQPIDRALARLGCR